MISNMPTDNQKYGKSFWKKEKVLNYACQTYQLSRPRQVWAVMELIRTCQPNTLDEWETFYFEKAFTESKEPIKITKEILDELWERLYEKITWVVIPEWTEAFNSLNEEDCKEYIMNLTIHRTYDGYVREKSVVHDNLEKKFPEVIFEESDPELDHAGDIDYIGKVWKFAFGIQIKPGTIKSNFWSYSASDRMKKNFEDFEKKYRWKVFIVYSVKEEIQNSEIYEQIAKEIERLKSL